MMPSDNIWEPKPAAVTAKPANSKSSIDFDVRRLISVWPWVIVFGIVGFLGGRLYLRYVKPVYQISTSINIEQDNQVSLGQVLFGSTRDPFNDEMAYFKSPALALQLVDSMGLRYRAVIKGTFKDKDLYGAISWKILNPPFSIDSTVSFTLSDGGAGFKLQYAGRTLAGQWGVPLYVGGALILLEKHRDLVSTSDIYCYAESRLSVAFEVAGKMVVTSTKESNIINISYSDYSPARAIEILNGLTSLYNRIIEQGKSRSFSQAISFIDSKLTPLVNELDSIESTLASFKSSKGYVGTSANGQLYLEEIEGLNKELAAIDVLKSTIANVEQFLGNPRLADEQLAMVGLSDPVLQSSVLQFHALRKEQLRLSAVQTNDHPTLSALNSEIKKARAAVDIQLRNYRLNLKMAETAYETNLARTNQLLRATPADEKVLLDILRKQKIKETIYLTLLQKQEEASIAKASITTRTRVLSPPAKVNVPEKPSRQKILLGAIAFGMILPLIVAALRELLNNKIISKRQIQGITQVPVVAELEEVKQAGKIPFVIDSHLRTMFGEQLRSLRTNLNFLSGNSSSNVRYYLVTSSMSGEGKSFLSLNLARSYSIQGKRVALLELDLRRPKMSRVLGISRDAIGLSDVLIGNTTIERAICRPSQVRPDEQFDFFPTGIVPPNPQELLTSKRMDELKVFLDANYDVVIIDTPPYGIVADAQILSSWATATLVVVRFNETLIEQVREIDDWGSKGLFGNMAIVFNGIRRKGYFGYKYGYYYYKSKYGNEYYTGELPTGK